MFCLLLLSLHEFIFHCLLKNMTVPLKFRKEIEKEIVACNFAKVRDTGLRFSEKNTALYHLLAAMTLDASTGT